MKFANPTSVQIGMSGTFAGIRYRVAGRVVMGMEEAGEIYYWQEFNLIGDSGQSATLVYESTGNGGEWKLFTLFEPRSPMTVAEAATKRVGDTVNLDGTPMRVTLVDKSQVNYIEGVAPEGVEAGDVAHYFNAEIPNKMLVVSWTGDEVEFYHGMDLPRGAVPHAFGLLRETPESSVHLRPLDSTSVDWPGKIRFVFIAGIVLIIAVPFLKLWPRRTGPVKSKLVAAPFGVGRRSILEGEIYRVTHHAEVEIAGVGQLYDRHEYSLSDDDGQVSLLMYGLKPGAKEWFFFTPLQLAEPFSAYQAAALRAGETVNVNGVAAPITEIFQSTIRQTKGSDSPEFKSGTVFYGFTAKTNATLVLVRWNANGIHFYRGKVLPDRKVTVAFGGKTGN